MQGCFTTVWGCYQLCNGAIQTDYRECRTRRFWEAEFEGSELNLAGWTHKITGKPSIAVGSVGLNSDFLPEAGATTFKEGEPASLDNLVHRISNNEFDLVAVGRALIANPDWANKIKYNQTDQLKPYNTDALMKLVWHLFFIEH